jgi:hypothetical protein
LGCTFPPPYAFFAPYRYLWHGNLFRALQLIEDLECDVDGLPVSPEQRKLVKAVREFSSYIRANRGFIPNYGERYRYGEAISTAFVESTVYQVISKRMVKQQLLRWTRRGAHNLLQIRTSVLDGEYRDCIAPILSWSPRSNKDRTPFIATSNSRPPRFDKCIILALSEHLDLPIHS